MSESKSVYTESIYARLLVFYETHVPEKFNTIDLQRIYDTYKDKKTTKLEKDLVKKYPVLPTSVLFSEVSRYDVFFLKLEAIFSFFSKFLICIQILFDTSLISGYW